MTGKPETIEFRLEFLKRKGGKIVSKADAG
jgi:hypothetical protein